MIPVKDVVFLFSFSYRRNLYFSFYLPFANLMDYVHVFFHIFSNFVSFNGKGKIGEGERGKGAIQISLK